MVNWKYLGYGVSNDNGVATLDYDAEGTPLQTSGYVGTGAGKIDMIASLDNPIEQGSFVSETFVVTDTLFFDDGINNPNNKWDTLLVTRSLESNGTKFIATSTNASARASMNPVDNASAYDFVAQPMVFECELVDLYISANLVAMQFIQQNPMVNKQIELSIHDIGHKLQVKYDGTELRLYVDGNRTNRYQTVTFDQTMRVGFAFYAEGSYVIVKNVKAYPI